MTRRPRSPNQQSENAKQLSFSFDDVLQSSTVLSREDVAARSHLVEGPLGYDPISQTTEYMRRAVQVEEAWETTVQQARQDLLSVDAKSLYAEFFIDLKRQIEGNQPRAAALASLLETVAIRGLGMTRAHVTIGKPKHGGTRWSVHLDIDAIRAHLDAHIIGEHFLNPLSIAPCTWRGAVPLLGASDVSQHRSAVPVPVKYFKRSVPFILNNAAGALFSLQDGKPKWDNLFNPKPNDELLRWMLIDPSYQDELDAEDYERCIASAMDVGQYKFDLEYLLKADRCPDIVFRDGSLFPQDAYLDNYVMETKRGEFTREAIRDMLSCMSYAKEVGVIYCGIQERSTQGI